MIVSKICAAILLAGLASSCVGTELEVPSNHPGHPQARSGELRRSTPLAPVPAPEREDQGDDHAGHQHGAEAPRKDDP